MFLHRVSATPDGEALGSPQGDGWKYLTWKEVGARVQAIATGLKAIGLEEEDRVSIVCSTRVDWILADVGILCAGGATTTIYPSSTDDECSFIIQDSNTRFVFAENADQLAKLTRVRDQIPNVKQVIVFDGAGSSDGWVITLAQLEEQGKAWDKANAGRYEQIARAVGPQHLATLIYTSGTTGRPKGVELTHDCWVFESEAIDSLGIMSPADRQFLFLPLAHSFGKVLEVAFIRIGFATAVDGRIEKVVDNLGTVKPTFVAAVPRIFEKVYNKVVGGAKEGGGAKYQIFKWAVSVGREVSALRQKGQEPGGFLSFKYGLATKLVFSKLQARFGGRLRFFISGSAPLSREIAEFFHAADILILEGYGLTETSAASYVNRPEKYRFGSVGVPVPGVEVKIDPADGEILLKGRGVMRGYHNNPEATAEMLMPDGWLRTGDIGSIDADGFLRITDRKKDLIKTSGGKYVAPQELENRLKTMTPLISAVVVHGNRRNFCTALVTLDPGALQKYAVDNALPGADTIPTDPNGLAAWGAGKGSAKVAYSDLAKKDEFKAQLKEVFDKLNGELPSYSTIKDFAVLPQEFSVETGELTPSMKVKRKAVEKKYEAILDGFYAGSMASL